MYKETSLLSIKPFKHPHFFCYTIPSCSVPMESAKNSSSFSLFSTSDIMFSTYQQHNHKRSNMTCKNNINATNNNSVIIFIGPIYCYKALWLYFREDVWKVFLGLTSFVLFHQKFFISRLYFYATGTQPWLLILMKTCTSFELYSGYFWLIALARLF